MLELIHFITCCAVRSDYYVESRPSDDRVVARLFHLALSGDVMASPITEPQWTVYAKYFFSVISSGRHSTTITIKLE